ncbi:LysR family transcriptional regulator [Paracoccus laeviglucosivorans]|uniref:Transcriptional regulator, LysR family n=1 Tax=Paracoccus laeviglucosivorans TaxID=1197861 RepID=A0A521ETE8_9RHOB|nr:LysR family transcriptional regulator [Paracoccus laeviglucosivorans]SMO87177.1 transcriptional regulator, LysR family [Paracoccus laeviglucosivorans]
MRPRRFLPSISQLLAFEAVLRTGSTTLAARELDLTQSTVSRLLQTLESQLGQPLFRRHRQRLTPLDAARDYGRDVTRALNLIQHAGMSLVVNPAGGTLSLAVLPTFAARWLAPRINGFLGQHPGVALNFATRVPRFSFEAEPFDAVIFYGQPDWPGAHHQKLFDEAMTACAAPDFLARHRITTPADLSGITLLHLENRPDAWAGWFAAQGARDPRGPGMMMDQFSLMMQAAIQGVGIALLPDYLAQGEIAEGRLAALPFPSVPGGAYWLAWPEAKDRHGPLVRFRQWIGDQAAP